MAINSAALLAELQTDPTAIGYAAPLAAGSFSQLVALLNEPRAGVSIRRGLVQGSAIINAIAVAEFEALTQIQLTRLMVVCSASGGVDTAGNGTRAILASLFGAGPSRAALIALSDRSGSRAELLFGQAVIAADIAAALGRG